LSEIGSYKLLIKNSIFYFRLKFIFIKISLLFNYTLKTKLKIDVIMYLKTYTLNLSYK